MELGSRKNEAKNDIKRMDIQNEVTLIQYSLDSDLMDSAYIRNS